MERKLTISWCADSAEVPKLADFFARNITDEYISHSELQGQRAIAPGKWTPELYRVLVDEMLERIPGGAHQDSDSIGNRAVSSATCDSQIAAVSYVSFFPDSPRPYAIIEDIVVARDVRGHGIGAAVLEWLVEQCRSRGMTRIFLESGVSNEHAHAFFEKHGFRQCSIVMMRDL